MRVALEALDVDVPNDVVEAVNHKVKQRVASSIFSGVQDLRLRLRRSKGALLCVAAVGFAGGDLVTSTATSSSPLEAIVDALDGLPERIDRVHRNDQRSAAMSPDRHAAIRETLKLMLDRA